MGAIARTWRRALTSVGARFPLRVYRGRLGVLILDFDVLAARFVGAGSFGVAILSLGSRFASAAISERVHAPPTSMRERRFIDPEQTTPNQEKE